LKAKMDLEGPGCAHLAQKMKDLQLEGTEFHRVRTGVLPIYRFGMNNTTAMVIP